jgi:MoaA/NifB/PqqE/SkfB family radical SAM enzyme
LAGGEPLLMNENKEFLQLLLKENPLINIRVNTNLSSTETGVFDLLCEFKNIHWTVSVETMQEQYEYVRYHGVWNDFLKNLKFIKALNHKITFNMLYFILNYKSIFSTVDFFKALGFHENSFVIGPLYTPEYLNILNLPKNSLNELKKKFINEIDGSGHYLRNSYENILKYISNTPWKKDITYFFEHIKILDTRRNQSAQAVFPELFRELQNV